MRLLHILTASALLLALPALSPAAETYSDDEVMKAASDFFATGAKDLASVLQKVLKEKGQPIAFIRGEEAGGAIGVGWRQGINIGYMKFTQTRKINPF